MPNPKNTLKRLQSVLFFGHMANDWCPGALWILLPAIGIAFDLEPSKIGLLVAIHAVGSGLAYLPAGILSDRIQKQGQILLLTFWWVGIGYISASHAPGFWSLALLLALAGIGDAVWHPVATGILARQMPKHRGQALGTHAIGGTLATVLSPLFAGFLLSIFNWRDVLAISAGPALLMGFIFFSYAKRIPSAPPNKLSWKDLKGMKKLWTSSSGLALIATISTYNMAVMALTTITPLFLQKSWGVSPGKAGTVFATGMLIGAIGQPIVGRISDRIGRKSIFVSGSILGAICAILAGLPIGVSWVSLSLALSIGILVAIRSGVLAFAVDFSGKREATTLGFVFLLMDSVGAVGAVFAGLIADIQLYYAFFLSAGLSLISILTITFVNQKR
jgi:FSR family fosmidomycin resistance protein-like MFS transporter